MSCSVPIWPPDSEEHQWVDAQTVKTQTQIHLSVDSSLGQKKFQLFKLLPWELLKQLHIRTEKVVLLWMAAPG